MIVGIIPFKERKMENLMKLLCCPANIAPFRLVREVIEKLRIYYEKK